MSAGPDPLDVASQDEAARDRAMRERMARESERDDVRWLMSSRRGRRIVWRTLESCGVFRSSYCSDAIAMAFREGQRNHGLSLLDLVHSHCADQWPAMIKESHEHERDERNDDDAGG